MTFAIVLVIEDYFTLAVEVLFSLIQRCDPSTPKQVRDQCTLKQMCDPCIPKKVRDRYISTQVRDRYISNQVCLRIIHL